MTRAQARARLNEHRLLLGIGSIAYTAWGLLFKGLALPGADPIEGRLAISAMYATLLGLTFAHR